MRTRGALLVLFGSLVFAGLAQSPLGDLQPSDNLALWLLGALLGLASLFAVTFGISMLGVRRDR